MIEGYHVFVGGGYGDNRGHRPRDFPERGGRRRAAAIEQMLLAYLAIAATTKRRFASSPGRIFTRLGSSTCSLARAASRSLTFNPIRICVFVNDAFP